MREERGAVYDDGGKPLMPDDLTDYLTDQISSFEIKEDEQTYTVEELPLDQLSEDGVQTITNYLGMGDNPQDFTLNEAMQQIDTLQQYWGMSNQEMITYLRETYYPVILDPFIHGADEIDRDMFVINGNQNDIGEEYAALAYTLLQLSAVPGGFVDEDSEELEYNQPLTPILIEGADQGFDHMIAGLDGHFNPIVDYVDDPNMVDPLKVFGIWKGDIESVPAVTYLGDLGGVVTFRLQQKDLNSAYDLSMPKQDFEGDVMATVIINSGLLENQDLSLADVFEIAYDPEGKIFPNRFNLFADAIELQVDPDTGDILNSEKFIEDNCKFVKAFGIGLYNQDIPKNIENELDSLGLSEYFTGDYSKEVLERFVDDIQKELWREAGSTSEVLNE
jgi:hypothetical protein